MDKNTRASESPSQLDLVECLKVIIGEMKRLPVLKHWDDAKRKGLVELPVGLRMLVDDACMDSMLLTIRAFDDFYRFRKDEPKGNSHLTKSRKADDLYAEQFGYIHDEQVLSKDRREAMNKELAHFTHRRATQRLRTVMREDVFSVLGPCIQFLDHVLSSGLLDDHQEIAKTAQAVRDDMQKTIQDPSWGVVAWT